MSSPSEGSPATSLLPLALLSISVFAQLVFLRTQPKGKKTNEEQRDKRLIPEELFPCDDPPAGLGLGKEDPVVAYYVQGRTDCEEWAESPKSVSRDRTLNAQEKSLMHDV